MLMSLTTLGHGVRLWLANVAIQTAHLYWWARRQISRPTVELRKAPEFGTPAKIAIRVVFIHGALTSYREYKPRWGDLALKVSEEFGGQVEFFTATWRGINDEEVRRRDADSLAKAISDASANERVPILLVGHSHGGSIASHATCQLRSNGLEAFAISIATPFVVVRTLPAPTGNGRRQLSLVFGALVAYGTLACILAFVGLLAFPEILPQSTPPTEPFSSFRNSGVVVFPYALVLFGLVIWILINVYMSKVRVDRGIFAIGESVHADGRFGAAIYVENDEINALGAYGDTLRASEELLNRLMRYQSRLLAASHSSSWQLWTCFSIPLCLAVAFLATHILGVDFRFGGFDHLESMATILVGISTLSFPVLPYRERTLIGGPVVPLAFVFPNLLNFFHSIFASRLTGLRPWPISTFCVPTIGLVPSDSWKLSPPVSPISEGLAHSEVLTNGEVHLNTVSAMKDFLNR